MEPSSDKSRAAPRAAGQISKTQVRDVMTLSPHTISPTATVKDALDLMRANKVHHLPVIDKGDSGDMEIIGIVSDRDLLRATSIFLGSSIEDKKDNMTLQIRVKSLMSPIVYTLRSNQTVKECIDLLLNKKIGCAPIMEGKKLAGIVTDTDLLHLLRELLD